MKREEMNVVGVDRGVEVSAVEQGFLVKFPFDRELVNRIHKVAGAEFNQSSDVWEVPSAAKDELLKVVGEMRALRESIEKDRVNIMELATATATARQQENGHTATPQVSEYRKLGAATYGEIVNVNARFAAQLTGFGKDDGAAFVTVHRLADLDKEIFKGDQVKIAYDAKGRGEVSNRKERAVDETLGKVVDGVKVEENGKQMMVSFVINPNLEARLRRVAQVAFDKDAQAFVVPVENREFVWRAVHDMRKEFAAEALDRESLNAVATAKVDNAVVRDAFTKDGQKQFGVVIAASDRFILQSGGMGQFKLHRKDALSGDEIVVGNNVEVAYSKGRGVVTDKTLEKAQGKEKAVGQSR